MWQKNLANVDYNNYNYNSGNAAINTAKTAQMQSLDAAEPFSLQSLPADGFTWPCVLEDEVFIIKLLPVDGFSAGAVVVGEVSCLAHELGDDTVEAAALEAKPFLVGAEAAEILCLGGSKK